MEQKAKDQDVLNTLKRHAKRVERADQGRPTITTLPAGCTFAQLKSLLRSKYDQKKPKK